MADVLSQPELDNYRAQADRFIAAIDEEYYLHYAGLKDTLELEPIYEQFAELTGLEQANRIGAAVNGDRRIRELWRFACQGYLGNLTREHEERTAQIEADLTATVDGEEIPYRMLRPTIANEADREKRQRLEHARNALTEEHLLPLQLDVVGIEQAAVRELGAPNYAELHRRLGFQLDELAGRARAFLQQTEPMFEQAADRLFRERVGVGLAEAKRWDVARLFRAPEWDTAFPADRMLPALEATLADLGIDLHAQENVELDVEKREKKTPRAFCAPIEVPQRVVLVIQPIGGVDDWRALFHEAGHTEHYAHTNADLAVEDRRLGDFAVTEGWAMLMEHLVQDAAWLNRRLDVPRPSEFVAEGATSLLYLVRRYCAKLLYEIELSRGRGPRPPEEAIRRAPHRRPEDRAERDRLPRRRRRRLLRHRLRARVGVRGAAGAVLPREVRLDLVRAAQRRLAAARALGRRPAADRGRAAEGADLGRDRARGGLRTRARRTRRRVAGDKSE